MRARKGEVGKGRKNGLAKLARFLKWLGMFGRISHISRTLPKPFPFLYNPFNSKFSFTPCRLHPASNGNSISESHPEYEGHAHHYVITITSSRGPNGGSSALPRPSSYTAAPRRTAPGHSIDIGYASIISMVLPTLRPGI